MKHNKIITSLMSFALLAGMYSCKKDSIGILNTGDFKDTTGTLKSVSPFPIGFAAYMGDAGFSKYFPIIATEGTNITPGNEMKYGSVVGNDGSLNFTNADALFNQATGAGLNVYGHTLLWYQQQNGTYLKGIVGDAGGSSVPNFVTNGSFEDGTNGWAQYNAAGGASFSVASGADVHSGNGALKAINPIAQSNYLVQYAGPTFTTTANTVYAVTFWVRATAAGGKVQVEWRNQGGGVNYSGDQTINSTSWTMFTFNYTATGTTGQVVFDLGSAANTYFIDDVSVVDKAAADAAAAAGGSGAIAERVDSVLHLWIAGTQSAPGIVTHYAGKIKAWDVVNEILTEGGVVRDTLNTPNTSKDPNYFMWSQYLGKDAALKAFQYAAEADPSALLFINDYNLESNKAKVDSLVAYVTYLKSKGAKVDGIGTQMHVNVNSSLAGIDYMFTKLASTGLLVRVSELDVLMNPFNKIEFAPEPVNNAFQASMYQYVVDSYIKNVPAAQRHGLTIWGVDDADSWRYNNGMDLPLLFDKNFNKKPAYSAVLQSLKAGK